MKRLDLTGFRFGALVILGPREKKWRARCDCGKQLDVTSAELWNGKRVSCGKSQGRSPISHALRLQEYAEHLRAEAAMLEEQAALLRARAEEVQRGVRQ